VARVGPQHITVSVRGETGTGKELIVSLVHAQGAVPMFAQPARAKSADLFAPAS
jgi:DNA-binding NtrC family response regulator